MKKYNSNEIRKIWIDFWKSKKHEVIPSSSLIPKNDPSILWINSGVATLKDYFSGTKIPKNPRLTNSQKCIRTNDIDNVGATARHHTLFEMLGNFSIGEYFKDDALLWAYEFLFDILKFEKNKIYITYYSKDLYTYNKWIELGINKNHLIKGDKKTNFWDLGSGPCGPDTEIFYDRGLKYDPNNIGLELLKQDIENDRYIEIWNIVFSELNNDGQGNYTDLRKKNIDTGAGLERIVSIFQDAPTNFDTDLFLPIIRQIELMCNKKYDINNYFIKNDKQQQINKHFRIIADHVRAASHAISDGAKPSNTKRGYIIRRLIRRAYRSGIQLGIKKDIFLYELVDVVQKVLPIYAINVIEVAKIIKKEEKSFSKTIKEGEELLSKSFKEKTFNMEIAFKLFGTYGFPIELTKELANEKGIEVSLSEFNKLKQKHADVSRGAKKLGMKSQIQVIKDITKNKSEFIGYDTLECESKVLFQAEENNKHYVLLDKTPFYATKGGQIHDFGTINNIEVTNVFQDGYNNHWHVLDKKIDKDTVQAKVNKKMRDLKAKNHSGTHILGHALRTFISKDIIQLGSENNEEKLRFDFPLDYKLSNEEVKNIENIANKIIKDSISREYIIDTFENGLRMGALAIDNEIESDPDALSRIVKFGDSIEFCGGTHVSNTNLIEKIKIIKIESKGSGTYRIEAITSNETVDKYIENKRKQLLETLNNLISKNKIADINYQLKIKNNSIESINKYIKQARKDNKKISKVEKNGNIDFDIDFVNYKNMETFIKMDVPPQDIKKIAIKLRNEHTNQLFIIGNNVAKVLSVSSGKYNSKDIFDELISVFGGKGGGNNSFAMGTILKELKLK